MGGIDPDLIPLIVLPLLVIAIASIIALPWVLKTRERFKVHETLKYVLDKGHAPPPELLAGLVEQPRTRRPGERDLRASVFWLSIAVGVSALGASIAWVSDPDGSGWIIAPGLGAFPGSIGIGYLILWFVNRAQQRI
jgi:hypothetical protein